MQNILSASTRIEGGRTIIDVVGKIDFGSSPALRKMLLDALEGKAAYVAVNLSEVKYLDSSGIASLLEALKYARDAKKRLVLFGVTGAVRQVLQLTRLTGVFEIFDTEQQVLDA